MAAKTKSSKTGKTGRRKSGRRSTPDLKRLERRHRQSESMFAALFESNPEAIIITRLKDAMILEKNAASERFSGHLRNDVVGRSAFELQTWVDPSQRAEVAARVLKDGGVSNFETRFRHSDGRELDVLLSGAKVEIEGDACVIWSWRDIGDLRKAERQAQQSLGKFTAVFETDPDGIVVTKVAGSGGRIVEMNDAALKLAGLTREEAIRADTLSIVRWEDPDQLQVWRKRALAGEQLKDVPLSFRRADGSRVEVLFSGAAVEIDGQPHIVVSMHDVTETRKRERALAELEERFEKAFHSSQEAIGVVRLEDLTMVEVNQRLEELYGAPAAEVVGRRVPELELWQDGDAVSDLILAALHTEGKVRGWQLGMRTRGGEIRQVVYNADLIEIAGEPHVIGFLRDETELHEAERRRRESEALLMDIARGVSAEMGDAFFRSLVEHLSNGLGADVAMLGELVEPGADCVRTLAVIEDGQMQPNFEYRLEGSPCAGVVQRRGTAVHPERVAELFADDAGLQRLGAQGYIGTSLFGTAGAPLGILVVISRRPIERPASWASVIEIFGARASAEIERARADARVREANALLEERVRERTAQLEAANRELDSYNYSISHDLRQPLNVISGFAELLQDQLCSLQGTESSETLDFVHEIESNAHRMELMIEALLEVARAGRGALSVADIDMNDQVESVLRDLAHGAPLHARVSVGELPPARGDATLLRQVWSNLVGNALKYSSAAEAPEVRIRGRLGDGVVEYEVGDNGVGFDMRYADRLFGVFQRLPNSKGFEGTGIGLAIVQRVVHRHGGRVSAESMPGQGTKIRFTLPV